MDGNSVLPRQREGQQLGRPGTAQIAELTGIAPNQSQQVLYELRSHGRGPRGCGVKPASPCFRNRHFQACTDDRAAAISRATGQPPPSSNSAVAHRTTSVSRLRRTTRVRRRRTGRDMLAKLLPIG